MQRIKSSIAPTFTFRVVFVGAFSILIVVAALFKNGDIVPLIFLAPINTLVVWTYFNTWYMLEKDRLVIHFGPFIKNIKYDEISNLSMPYAYLNLSLMGLSHSCIAVEFKRLISHTVCISPINQHLFFDELCERCKNFEDN